MLCQYQIHSFPFQDGVQGTEVKFFFDDEVSRCLEVNSEYKRIFVGPFLLCEIKGVCAFKPDEIARIQSVERRGCKSSLTRGEGEGCSPLQCSEVFF